MRGAMAQAAGGRVTQGESRQRPGDEQGGQEPGGEGGAHLRERAEVAAGDRADGPEAHLVGGPLVEQ